MKVEVFHNISRDASFGLNTVFNFDLGVTRPKMAKRQAATTDEQHQLVKVFEYETDRDADFTLEDAFETFNVGTDELAQQYRARKLRSLSVGDVVTLDALAYSVEPGFQFQRRFDTELRIVTDPAEAERLIRERYHLGWHEELTVTVPWSA